METPTSQGIRLSLAPLRIHARTGSSGLSAPFCPFAFLLSAYQSEGWLAGAVGIEPVTPCLQSMSAKELEAVIIAEHLLNNRQQMGAPGANVKIVNLTKQMKIGL